MGFTELLGSLRTSSTMTALKSLRYLVAVGAALTALWVLPGVASAFDDSYCGALIDEDYWCGDGSRHTFDYNRAEYNGTGNVWVCERLLYDGTSTVRAGGPSCGYNYQTRSYGPTTSLFNAQVTHYYSGGARHTIYGFASTT